MWSEVCLRSCGRRMGGEEIVMAFLTWRSELEPQSPLLIGLLPSGTGLDTY